MGKGHSHSGAVVSQVERASKYTPLSRGLGERRRPSVGTALLSMVLPLCALVHTITSGNGKEFAGHAWVAKAVGSGFFLAARRTTPENAA